MEQPDPLVRGNPYRILVRRRPGRFHLAAWLGALALMAYWASGVMMIHEDDSAAGLTEDEVEMALVHLDRAMRISDATEGWPTPGRWMLLGWADRETGLKDFRDGFAAIDPPRTMHMEVTHARSALRAEVAQARPRDVPWPDDDRATRWWHVQAMRGAEGEGKVAGETLKKQEEINRTLARRGLVSLLAVWALGVAGLWFLPGAWRRGKGAWGDAQLRRKRRIPWRWPLVVTVGVFLLAELSADTLYGFLYDAYGDDGPGDAAHTGLDFVWRVTPPLVVMLLLFRRARHAFATLGIRPAVDWRLVLASFGLLMVFDLGWYAASTTGIADDITGGLDPMEAGAIGLVYGLLSACVAAPVAEEIQYRGFLLRGFERRLGLLLAFLLSTVAFVVVHDYDLFGLISVGVFGVVAAWVYLSSGSLTNAIVLHALYNLSITLPMWWIYHAGY